jgi:hypothetical protein
MSEQDTPKTGDPNPASDLDSAQDIDAMLERGAAVLRASGRLLYEDPEADRLLVLAILDAVMPLRSGRP